jgi:hypothetical protein
VTTAVLITTLAVLGAFAQVVIHARRVAVDALPDGWRVTVRMFSLLGFAAISAVALAGHRNGDVPVAALVTALIVAAIAPRLIEEISWESGASPKATR